MINLKNLGWSPFFQKEFDSINKPGLEAGRVAVESKHKYALYTRFGELTGEVSGRLLYDVKSPTELPKTGDWVAISVTEDGEKAIIHQVLKRKSKFSRKVAGKKTEEQIIATNIDIIFIVQGLDSNYNLRRLERYLVTAYESGAKPIIILNKVDLCKNYEEKVSQVEQIVFDVPILAVSAKTNYGIDTIKKIIKNGLTYAFIGSSGVGKSTLINKIIGKEILKTREVREKDSRGRHATDRRELIILPEGGLLVDTPGMRELQLWSVGEGMDEAFADIEELAAQCHFSDCSHSQETNCAVLAAVKDGKVSEERYNSYLKLQKELKYLETKQNESSFLAEKRRMKQFSKEINRIMKAKIKRKWQG